MANPYQKATKNLQNIGRTIAKDYTSATKGLQNVGKKIASNVSQGQKNLQSGGSSYYGAINPLKGTGKAFVGSFKKGGKVKKTGMAKVHKGEVVVPKKTVKGKSFKQVKKAVRGRKFNQKAYDRQSAKVFGK
jgi:hypothetical protein